MFRNVLTWFSRTCEQGSWSTEMSENDHRGLKVKYRKMNVHALRVKYTSQSCEFVTHSCAFKRESFSRMGRHSSAFGNTIYGNIWCIFCVHTWNIYEGVKQRRWQRAGILNDIAFVETCTMGLWSLIPRHLGIVAQAKLRTHDLQ